MVFLRLTVKVFPRDQAPPSNSFSFRSLLGDRERDDASRTSSGTASGKPASFLIVLENPDDVTLGGLAGMIREKWRKLRPGAEPIAIKKLLDDDHESDDLDTDMTVADVFVDKGKARLDGLDQRRIVRVIQKPASGVESPVRFPSVAQDWDAAAERYEMQRREKSKKEAEFALNKLGPITEEAQESAPTSPMHMDSWSDYTPGRKHRRDIPLSSVEKDHEVPLSPSQQPRKSLTHEPSQEPTVEDSSAPQENRLGSEELGDSPRSSRATTPRKPPSRRGSIQSEKFVNQSENARVVDSPGDQLVRESTHSVSPQKRLPLKETKPDLALLNGNPRAEETASSSNDSDERYKDTQTHDLDGDVTMVEDSAPKTQSPMTQEPITVIDVGVETQSRKRKNSAEQSSPKKEPRLDQSTPPPSVNRARRDSEVSPGTPRFSPSGRRLGGTGPFTGAVRRLGFTDYAEQPSTGLGLGITRSPSKKALVKPDLSQETASSSLPQSTPVPVSASNGLRETLGDKVSTPANPVSSTDKLKHLNSAMRKDSPASRDPARRSVSFADDDEPLITESQPAPRSTPMNTGKAIKAEPASQVAASNKRRSSSSMVFPPGVSPDLLSRYEREATETIRRRDEEKKSRDELEQKLKAAQKDKLNPVYLAKLQSALTTWDTLLRNEKQNRQGSKLTTANLRAQHEKQLSEIKDMEASLGTKLQGKGKKAEAAKKTTKPQQNAKDNAPVSKAPTAKVTPTSAPAVEKKSPVTQIAGWNAVNSRSPDVTKPAAPTVNGTDKTNTIKARTVATRTLSQQTGKPSLQSQTSTASDDVELPTMKVHARTNSKKSAPVEISSDDESESSEDETSSSESGSSTSDSDSDSESESDSPKTKKSPAAKTSNKPTPIPSNSKLKPSPPSAQRATKSPGPSTASQSQSQPASQTWHFPGSQRLGLSRPSLKSARELASKAQQEAAAKAAPKRNINGPPRKDIFERPDSSSSDETETSSSESESSDSDSDSEKEKANGKRAKEQSPVSVGDEGDIMSSGHVKKLRPARMTS